MTLAPMTMVKYETNMYAVVSAFYWGQVRWLRNLVRARVLKAEGQI